MSKKPQGRDGTFQSQAAPEDDGIDSELGTEAAPAVDVDSELIIVDAAPASGDDKVAIIPRKTIAKVRIGKKYHSFTRGQRQFIPRVLIAHLKRIGVL